MHARTHTHTHTHRKMLSSWPIPSSFESILVVTWAAKSRTLHRFTPEGGQRDLFLQPGVLHNLCMHRVLGGGASTGDGQSCVSRTFSPKSPRPHPPPPSSSVWESEEWCHLEPICPHPHDCLQPAHRFINLQICPVKCVCVCVCVPSN